MPLTSPWLKSDFPISSSKLAGHFLKCILYIHILKQVLLIHNAMLVYYVVPVCSKACTNLPLDRSRLVQTQVNSQQSGRLVKINVCVTSRLQTSRKAIFSRVLSHVQYSPTHFTALLIWPMTVIIKEMWTHIHCHHNTNTSRTHLRKCDDLR